MRESRENLYEPTDLIAERVKYGLRRRQSVSRIISGCGRSRDQVLPVIERYINMKDAEREGQYNLFLSSTYLDELEDELKRYRAVESRRLRPGR